MDPRELDRLYLEHVACLEEALARVLAKLGWDALVVHSGSAVKRSRFDDQSWPLRPCPHFQHWVPLAEPEALLVVRPGARTRLLRTATPSFWEAPPPPESEAFHEAMDVARPAGPAAIREHVGAGRVAFVGEHPDKAGA